MRACADDEIQRASEIRGRSRSRVRQDRDRWTGETTTLAHIRIIDPIVQGKCRIKASGGIRNLQTVKAMISVGVARFGINTGVALELMKECALSEAS